MDNKERNKLIKEHLPFIKTIAFKYKNMVEADDLIQEGILGLVRATETFDDTKDVKFLTYASYWIKVYIARYIQKQRKYQPVSDEYNPNVWNTIKPDFYFEDLEDNVISKDLHDKTYDELTKHGVTKRELDIVLSRYLSDEPCTLQELGEKYGVSRQRIEQIEKRMIDKIKVRLRG